MIQLWHNYVDELAHRILIISLRLLHLRMLQRDQERDVQRKTIIWIELDEIYRLSNDLALAQLLG